jgi:hypothetical protein
MKTQIACLCTIGAITLAVTGCNAPELAETPYGEKEQQWSEYLKEAYPEWEAPKTYPPLTGLEEPVTVNQGATEFDMDMDEVNEIVNELALEIEPAPIDFIIPDAPSVVIEEEPVATGGEEYLVQKNDTLWGISTKFYQDGTKWKRIVEANPELNDPKKLKPGVTIRIPLP